VDAEAAMHRVLACSAALSSSGILQLTRMSACCGGLAGKILQSESLYQMPHHALTDSMSSSLHAAPLASGSSVYTQQDPQRCTWYDRQQSPILPQICNYSDLQGAPRCRALNMRRYSVQASSTVQLSGLGVL
jgi:hypothetical protein